MKRLKHVKFISPEEEEIIAVLADSHIGHPNADIKKLKKNIAFIKDNRLPWLHLGDWADFIPPTDRRYTIGVDDIMTQFNDIKEIFNPIKDLCIAILRGNHGSKWSRTEGDIIKQIAKEWDTHYLGYCGFVTIKLKKNSYKLWLHHGAGGGRKRGAKVIRLQDWSGFVDADIYLQGHTHTPVIFTDQKLTPFGKRLRWFANTPGYIDSYTGHDNYVEEWGLPPQPTGYLEMTLGDSVKIEAVLE